jgi:hypothetical protein
MLGFDIVVRKPVERISEDLPDAVLAPPSSAQRNAPKLLVTSVVGRLHRFASAAATDMRGRGPDPLAVSRRCERSERAKERASGSTMGSSAI